MGRAYFNMDRSYTIPEHKMEVYPGFQTAIAEYGAGRVMLQIDVSHRILRNETAYEVMLNIYQKARNDADYKLACQKALIGQIVMTK